MTDRNFGDPPKKGSKEWVRNEKIINNNPHLKQMRDKAEGFSGKLGQTKAGKVRPGRGANGEA